MKKYLIVQTAFIGDVILATSLVALIKSQEPDVQIDFCLRKGNEGLLKGHPDINQVWIWEKQKGKFLNLLKLAWAIRKQKYSAVINIQRFFNSGLITALSGAPIRIGFRQNPMSLFFNRRVNHQIPHYQAEGYLHEVQRNALLYQQLNPNWQMQPATALRPKIEPSEQDFQKISEIVTEQKPYLVFAPASVWFTKQWPWQKWQELTQKLSSSFHIYFIGAPSDYELSQKIMGDSRNCTNLCGKLNLLQSAALMKDATRVIVNDSAPLHLASGMNAKTTAIFCSTIPEFGYTPISENHAIVQRSERLPCTPCGLHGKSACPLGHYKCAFDIDTSQVIATI